MQCSSENTIYIVKVICPVATITRLLNLTQTLKGLIAQNELEKGRTDDGLHEYYKFIVVEHGFLYHILTKFLRVFFAHLYGSQTAQMYHIFSRILLIQLSI